MKLIRLCYRKLIDADSKQAWEKMVFDDTHLEYYMQAQRIDPEGRFPSFRELAESDPRTEELHYLTSTAAIGYIRQLNDTIPEIANQFGKSCLPFKHFRFEIVSSHNTDKSLHRIAIWFYSEPVRWLGTVGEKLIISYQTKAVEADMEVETDMIPLVPFLSISSITEPSC